MAVTKYRIGLQVALVSGVCWIVASLSVVAQEGRSPIDQLASQLTPYLACLSGTERQYSLQAEIELPIDGKPQRITARLDRHDGPTFDVQVTHDRVAARVVREPARTALILPLHKVAFVGRGDVAGEDTLLPQNGIHQLIGPGSMLSIFVALIGPAQSKTLATSLVSLLQFQYDEATGGWQSQSRKRGIEFAADDSAKIQVNEVTVTLRLQRGAPAEKLAEIPSDFQIVELDRTELERHLSRGLRRLLEVAMPSPLLTLPAREDRSTPHGQLRWIDNQRVVLLHGTPEEIGRAHGTLLREETYRCMDSVLYMFGTVQTILTGKWFPDELQTAHRRLVPHIPTDHQREIESMALALGVDNQTAQLTNVFPELFHCSGFAVYGSATRDGKLYHGRVLDYMTTIGLQDSATTFVVAVEGKIPFINVGYAGFVGSVSGMNDRRISLGEMGGAGQGQWDGVPMATLMRRALEECSTLEEVRALWTNSPRTCEYYYVFADGNANAAVGVAATPESIEFVEAGQSHPRLGDGIKDSVVLSAGDRLATLRKRIESQHGQLDVTSALDLMKRPVAMRSNLHNVLFVPADRICYVANADHQRPAAECPYVCLSLPEILSWQTEQLAAGSAGSSSPRLSADTGVVATP